MGWRPGLNEEGGEPSRRFLQSARVQVVGEVGERFLPVNWLCPCPASHTQVPGKAGAPACPGPRLWRGQGSCSSSDRTAGSGWERVRSLPRLASQARVLCLPSVSLNTSAHVPGSEPSGLFDSEFPAWLCLCVHTRPRTSRRAVQHGEAKTGRLLLRAQRPDGIPLPPPWTWSPAVPLLSCSPSLDLCSCCRPLCLQLFVHSLPAECPLAVS